MNEDRTYAELLEEESTNFPLDHDHHPTISYSVGWNLGRLQGLIIGRHMNQDITVDDVYSSLYQAQVISYDSNEDFQITEAIDEVMKEIDDKYEDSNEKVNIGELVDLSEDIGEWSDEYVSELGDMDIVSTVDKGIIDTREIFRNPNSIFEEQVWNWLDDQPRDNLKQSCKTLALDMRTASGFLALRSVEYCLRDWYEEETGNIIEKATWGGVLKRLESVYEDRDRPAVLSNLDYLQKKRAGVAHPDKNPSWDEAEDTLLTVRRTISEIHESIE